MFPSGLVVYFRLLVANNQLASSIHPDARDVQIERENYLKITDKFGNGLGYYERDFIACILPLKTVGPASNENPSNSTSDSREAST